MDFKHGLGRVHSPDVRDARFPLAALLPPLPPKITTRYYSAGPILDQGQTSECVAFAWKQWLDSAPIKDPQANPPEPEAIYRWAQAVDGDPTPHDGTTVRAGAQVIQSLHRLGAYHWSTSADDVKLYLLSTGSVVFGVNWYESMFQPERSGFLKISGAIAGGHAFLCIGYSASKGAFRFINSWGRNWGQFGRFWLSGEDVQRLLNEDGEACAGTEIRVA